MTAVDRSGRLAIIVPVLNEAAGIEAALAALQGLRKRGARLIVVDGGSQDDTPARAGRFVDEMLTAERGRARQMNAGAARAGDADVLLFLHADTRLPTDADCTGDQAIFIERHLFEQLHGYADMPLMEDIEFSRRARALASPAAISVPVVTSGRRWEQRGIWQTIWLMWSLRWRYWRGEDPAALAREYREVR